MRRLLAMATLFAVVVAGCGGDGEGNDERRKNAPPRIEKRAATATERVAIQGTVKELERAIEDEDVRAICNLYTKDARETASQSYTSCDTAVRSDIEGEPPPRLTVGPIEVADNARDREPPDAGAPVTSSARGRDAFTVDAVFVFERDKWRLSDGVLEFVLPPSSDSGSGGGGEEDLGE